MTAVLAQVSRIGLRPMLAGAAVLVIAAVAGWGMAADRRFFFLRGVRFWVQRVILPALRHRKWLVRTLVILFNNATTCALLILAGRLPGGSWTGIAIVGLLMGVAVRILAGSDLFPGSSDDSDQHQRPRVDPLVHLGLLLNLVEVPAIVVTLGLSMGQLAAPNGLPPSDVWRVFLAWVIPALSVAAGGESLWIGRLRHS